MISILYKINLIIHAVYIKYSISAANKQIEELKNLLQSKSTLFEELSAKNAELDNQLKSKSTLFDASVLIVHLEVFSLVCAYFFLRARVDIHPESFQIHFQAPLVFYEHY